jgi:hypothetical protein
VLYNKKKERANALYSPQQIYILPIHKQYLKQSGSPLSSRGENNPKQN